VIPLVVLVLALGPAAAGASYRPDLTRAVEAPAYCFTESGWRQTGFSRHSEGMYLWDLGVAAFRSSVCQTLTRPARSFREQIELSYALHTVAHERQHALGVVSEDEAECEGARTIPLMAKRLAIKLPRRALGDYLIGHRVPKHCHP
jgi:hypothetical protein